MKLPASLFCLALPLLTMTLHAQSPSPATPIPVKVVVVAMFEVGKDSGDEPGELQTWVEQDHLDHVYDLPAAYHAARMNDQGELAIVTGQGTAHAASTLMALGLDPRFDLSHAYWVIAGIAGGNPDRVSLSSAAWARYIIDTDLAYEIDSREIPSSWSTGRLPLRHTAPFQAPVDALDGQVFELNARLAQWAFDQTRNTPIPDSDHLRLARQGFSGASSQRPPFVTLGDEVSGSTFWFGQQFNAWADRWASYYTHDQAHFATTAMEDTGTLLSLRNLARAGRIDYSRVLVLRTVSNYDQPPTGVTAAESLEQQRIGRYSAFRPAIDTAYRVGHVVVSELLNHWPQYSAAPPR